jgi:predicted transcriptional regulator
MNTRLVNTSTAILCEYLKQYLKNNPQKNLTSGLSIQDSNDLIDSISFGSNEIIDKIGKDRSHISKAIKFLKKTDLLKEHNKWSEGKAKDTRITKLGLEIAQIVKGIHQYDEAYSKFREKIEAHYKLPKKVNDYTERKEILKDMGWDQTIVDTYDLSLIYLRMIEFGLLSCFINIAVSKYTSILLKSTVKSDVKSMMEQIMVSFIRDRLKTMTITNDYLHDEKARDYASNKLASTIIHPNFTVALDIIEYLQFEYEDLPPDGNKKFIKEDVRNLLKTLFQILNPSPQQIPRNLEFEEFREFLPGIDLEAVQKEWQKIGVGDNQVLSLCEIENTTEWRQIAITEEGGYYDATTDFLEISIGRQGTDIKPRKIARCSFFWDRLIIFFHKDVKLNTFSKEFQENYEHGKNAIYGALREIDYVSEYGLDMPTFEIFQNENGLVKSIKIHSLARDLHSLISQIVIQVVIRTLAKTDPKFLEFLKEIERKKPDKSTNGDNQGKYSVTYEEDAVKGKEHDPNKNKSTSDNASKSIRYDMWGSGITWDADEDS